LNFKIIVATIKTSVSISIEGLVQGVGFRPFAYHLAKKHNLNGSITNRSNGVFITISGEKDQIDNFQWDIIKLSPPAAIIKKVVVIQIENIDSDIFQILPSENLENQITEISPDIAVCDDCLNDLKTQDHRINYPFINCTHCGPRFSIVKNLPYDRLNTTMHEFEMCTICNHEYYNVDDRRFHAQPLACNQCGPNYILNAENDFKKIITEISSRIKLGEVIAVKGLGGYIFICDAQNNNSVLRIREIKGRDGKPFAVMFRDSNAVLEFCQITNAEKELLESWRRPIVILDEKKELCVEINSGLKSIGAMLPYLPFHYLLFNHLKIPAIVYTSANNSGEPIISNDLIANQNLSKKVDAFVSHNRKIENPLDDSVVKLVNNKQQIIRRARGFVPSPIELNYTVDGIFAAGAELKNSFCIGKNNAAILSQHIGDLMNFETFSFYKKNVQQFFDLFRFEPRIIACDMHPDYLSTRFAENLNLGNLNGNRIPVIKVQHHHAHIVSCMAEYHLNEKVIGVSFDGTGYGTDDNIWGGEFLICDNKSFERFSHFDYVKMPGGDLVVEQPWRMVLAYLNNSQYKLENLDCLKNIGQPEIELVLKMISQNINSPLTSSAGRLFDVVACLLNLYTIQTFDAEGPMRLESIADRTESGSYLFEFNNGILKFDKTLDSIIIDLKRRSIPVISAKFHNTIVQAIKHMVIKMRNETGLNKVILSGGVFQNRVLLEKSIHILNDNKFKVFTNHSVPPNDGGIALGQLVIASNFL